MPIKADGRVSDALSLAQAAMSKSHVFLIVARLS
jgi:hypothetical protein